MAFDRYTGDGGQWLILFFINFVRDLNPQALIDKFGCSVKARVGKVKKGLNVRFFEKLMKRDCTSESSSSGICFDVIDSRFNPSGSHQESRYTDESRVLRWTKNTAPV